MSTTDGVLGAAQARLEAKQERLDIARPALVPPGQRTTDCDRDDGDHRESAERQHAGEKRRVDTRYDDPPDPTDPLQTNVPDGKYIVAYRKDEKGFPYGRCVRFVHFVIVEPEEHRGKMLLRFINEPRQWKGKRRGNKTGSLPHSSSLWDDYLAITGRRPPNRVFALSELYSGALLRAVVVEVKERSNEGGRVEVPEAARYSKIQRFLGQGAGPHSSSREAPQL